MKKFLHNLFPEGRLKLVAWLALLFAVLLWLFPEVKPLPTPQNRASVVSIYNENSVKENLFEITLLGDSSPLFLPTNLNFAPPKFELPRAGGEFINAKKESPMEAMKTFEVSFALRGGSEIPMSFFLKNQAFTSFMRVDASVASQNQNPLMTIMLTDTGKTVYSSHIEVDFDTKGTLWSPMKMTIAVAEDGSISPPLVTSISGIEELDLAFENYVKNNIAKILAGSDKGGFYEVTFSP